MGKRVGGDKVKIGRAVAAEADILKGEDNIGAIGAEGGVTITAVAFERSYFFKFVCVAIVEHEVTIAAVAPVAVDEEKQVAVVVVADDLVGEFETPIRKIIDTAWREVVTLLNIHEANGICKLPVDVGYIFDGKSCASSDHFAPLTARSL